MATGLRQILTRGFAGLLLIAFVLVWIYAGTLKWRANELAETINASLLPLTEIPHLPWADEPPRQAARHLLKAGDYDPSHVRELLETSLEQRPLYAPTWVDYAEFAYQQDQAENAGRYLSTAQQLWPHRPLLLWRVIRLQLKLGAFDNALNTLANYWEAKPEDYIRVLALAKRLESDPEHLVAALFKPLQHYKDEDLSLYLYRLLGFARRARDANLAHQVWLRLPQDTKREGAFLFPYLQLLSSTDEYDLARTAWRQTMLSEAKRSENTAVYNGSFEQPLLNGGFAWRHWEKPGFELRRDRQQVHSGNYSLMIEFDGKENVDFSYLRQTLLIEPGQPYVLSGFWRGGEITTRSGVYIELRTLDGENKVRAELEPRWGSWEWQRFSLGIQVPQDSHRLEILIRRRATSALDRYIAGTLWLDDLSLTVSETIYSEYGPEAGF